MLTQYCDVQVSEIIYSYLFWYLVFYYILLYCGTTPIDQLFKSICVSQNNLFDSLLCHICEESVVYDKPSANVLI